MRTCNFRLKNLARIGSKLDTDLKKTLVQNYILTRLDYCNSIFTSLNSKNLNKLQSVLNSAAHFVFNDYNRNWNKRSSSAVTEKLLFDLHFLPVQFRVIFKICLLCYKCINQQAPSYLSELINLREQSAYYNLRIDTDVTFLNIPTKPHLKKSEFAFEHYAPSIWNEIPAHIRATSSIKDFKTRLKTFLFDKAYPHFSSL